MRKQSLISLALFIAFIVGMAIIQFSTPDMPDNDGFYHIKLAWLMRTEGLKPDFIWLPMSILNESEFYDHHFLFHAALIPFTFGDLRVGAKWAAVVFSAVAFICVWYLFYRQKISLGWLWALALLGISDAFLFRMSITRAQSLSLAVLALGLAWTLEGKHKHLAVLSFLYVWMYDAFPLILAVTGIHLFSTLVIERRLDYRPLLWAGIGVLAGLIINPYFPQNLIFTYHHILPKLTDATSTSVGNEWFPYDTQQLLDNSLPSLIFFASGIFALGISGRKMDVRTATSLLVALLFGLMLFKARRFIEYFPPFAMIFSAFAWDSVFEKNENRDDAYNWLPQNLNTKIFAIVLFLTISLSAVRTFPKAEDSINNSKPYTTYLGSSFWLSQNTEEGDLVFQTDWDDFPRLFFYNTRNVYLVGLDPTYFQLYDPELYDLWVQITRGAIKNPSTTILRKFSAHYVHTDTKHQGFLESVKYDRGMKEVYRDDHSVIFEIVEP